MVFELVGSAFDTRTAEVFGIRPQQTQRQERRHGFLSSGLVLGLRHTGRNFIPAL